jgi:DNA excision repair protein ERCC-4
MINDIFSKAIKEAIPKSKIIIDTRERNSLVPPELLAKGIKTEIKQLKVGDYIINDLIIERKEINDLVHSIKNKRIFNQLNDLKKTKNKLLIIEGNIYSQKSLSPNAIKGFILSTTTNYKIPIIFTSHPKETAQYLALLSGKTKKEHSLNVAKKEMTHSQRQQFILESFEGIGPKTAQILIEKFQTLKNIFNQTENTLNPIIGKKTKKFLKQLN